MLLHLFWSQATSPQPLIWHSHLKCLGDDCHLFKSFYNIQKSVAPVQTEFEFEKEPHFCCCQNWSNQFCKIQKNARFKNFKLMEFCALYLILKDPQSALFMGKWHCLLYGYLSLHEKLVKPILHDQVFYEGILKIFEYIFYCPYSFSFLFFSSAIFLNSQRALPFCFPPSEPPQPSIQIG